MKPLSLILSLCCALAFGQANQSVEIKKGIVDEDGTPTAPASVCLVSKANRECYTPPKHIPPYGLRAEASTVSLRAGLSAVLFKADSWAGGSGILTIVALLLDRGGSLVNTLPDVALTNSSEYRLWTEATVSDTALFVTAEYVWGEGESHFGRHHYRVSTYCYSKEAESYMLRDEYVTLKKYPGYDQSDTINVLEPERHEIISRLQHQER